MGDNLKKISATHTRALGTTAKAMAKRRVTVLPDMVAANTSTAPDIVSDTFGDVIDDTLSEKEQQFLECDVLAQIQKLMPADKKEDLEELSEYVVCMLRARKKPSEIRQELEGFLGTGATDFVRWLVEHLKGPWLL